MICRERIREEIAKQGHIGVNPRHVEAYIRLEHPTLGHLSRAQFAREVAVGIDCVNADGIENAEMCAKSLGI